MEKTILMNLTMNQKTTSFNLPVNDSMSLVEFFISLQLLLTKLDTSNKPATTFDIYDLSFNRIALVGDSQQLHIDDAYKNLKTIKDLLDVCIETIEVITLGTTPVFKVLQEEKYLKDALDNYKFE